jgi:hypothetical protein
MNKRKFPSNYSENDITKLLKQGQRKADYINKIIDTDIHINMTAECNMPINEKSKYLRNNYDKNNHKKNIKENNLWNNIDNSNINIYKRENYIRNNNNNRIFKNQNYNKEDEYNYNYEYDMNNNFNNSLILNKPFHRERRHFPLINNKGNFFKIITPFLVGNTEKMYSVKNKNETYDIYYKDNYNINQNYYNKKENIMRKILGERLRRNNSMRNMHVNHPNIRDNIIMNGNQKEYGENISYYMGNEFSRRYKYYNPYRYDYEGSRFGDNTYNYYLNAPMRGDISADWKYPPLYYYNYKSIYGL